MRLSKHFMLHEFLVSQTAERFEIDMTPSEAVIENITVLTRTCLQPLRESLGTPIFISSGYRPQELNERINGSPTSAHLSGSAADFVAAGYTPLEVSRRCVELELPFDQVIHEFGRWVHLGISRSLRNETLTASKENGRTVYAFGLHHV